MYRGSIVSALLHVAVLLFAYFGLPHFARPPLMVDYPVPVEIVTIAEKTNVPPPKPAEVKPEPPKPEPPKPEPAKPEPPPPPPPPQPEAVAPPPPEPEPLPKPEPPKAVVEAPTPLPKPKQKPEPAEKPVKPERKPPPPPDQFASVLKTVEKLKTAPAEPRPRTAEATSSRPAPPSFNAAAPITISQIDAIRRHFEKCWTIPAGAREAENLLVDIKVELDPDATVQRAEIVDRARMLTDPFYRAAAESALRAVLNPLCRSLKEVALPPEQYEQWKDMTISFNPKEMIGA
jgi:outer membrane biosynthesis protein TonB